jgi:prevent-host-death family protein
MKTKTTLPITEARKKIFSIVQEVQKVHTSYTLTERGKPTAVILSAENYESLVERRGGHLMLADKFSSRYANHNQSHIFPGTLIIRDESRVVYLSGDDQNEKNLEEGLIKAQLYIQLIEKYNYPLNLVEYGRYVKTGPKESKRYIEADIIINDGKGNVRMIFEVSPFDDFEKNTDKIVSDLFDLSSSVSWVKKPEYLIYFSRSSKNGEAKEKIIVVDCAKFNTFASWKKAGRPGGKSIPKFLG